MRDEHKISNKAKGGYARAKKLSSAERSEIARNAALERYNPSLLRATHAGDLQIGSMILPCSVLENGARVLSMRGINIAFTGKRGGGISQKEGAQNLPRFLATSDVIGFISKDLTARINSPVEYKPTHGGRSAFGYEATLLPEICEVILDANKSGQFKNPSYAEIADVLIRGFARVGIIALIDEATGYQEIRDRKALAEILDKYLRKELAAWAKRFPDGFYKEMFRLKSWPWNPESMAKPGVVGKYTNDLIYDRLAPDLVQELQRKNPKNDKGNRSNRHHQWLSDEVGHPALAQHLHAIVGFMRASNEWESFYKLVQKAFPKKNENLPLF